ncbi:hypothetical protein Ancab_017975 [Ancistrocladus abbreviatus]
MQLQLQLQQHQHQDVTPGVGTMDSVFQLTSMDRANFLLSLMQSCRCTYFCLWSYSSHHNCLSFEDGYYHEEINQIGSASRAGSLFIEYQQQPIFIVENDFVPGLAFKRRSPYMALQEADLQRLASTESQRQFYLEARIKTAVFMGCTRGEIELGTPNLPQINLEMEMQKWFSEDFSRQSPLVQELPQTTTQEQTRPSSSSSPSIGSPEYTSLLFSLPSSSYFPEQVLKEAPLMIEEPSKQISTTTSTLTTPRQQRQEAASFAAFRQLQNPPFPTPEFTDAAIARAILAVLSSPDPSSSILQQTQASAFKRYKKPSAPSGRLGAASVRRQNSMKRSMALLRSLNYKRLQLQAQASRPTSTQLHHMISERKRREKINESLQALRSLLPPGTKKDKASVLRSTKEYLSCLKSQISQLSQRNQQLEEQLQSMKKNHNHAQDQVVVHHSPPPASTDTRPNVRVITLAESTSEHRFVNLQVTCVGDSLMLTDLIIRILEFLKQFKEIKLEFTEAQTHPGGQNQLIMRLRIEENNWDESAFQEAIRRIVAPF